jgi:DNA-binding response OmpR family regulator
MHRILLVEDNPELAEGLQRNLEVDGYEVMLATRAAHALPLASSAAPDLVVLDLGLPDRDGYTVLQELRSRGAACPVLILSARNLEADKLQGFRLGADDYVTKPFSVLELLARISALIRRAAVPAPAPAAVPAGGAARPEPPSDEELRAKYGLTEREVAVTRLLAEGYSNAEVASRLEMSYFTARNHTERVMRKLGLSKRAAVAALLYRTA